MLGIRTILFLLLSLLLMLLDHNTPYLSKVRAVLSDVVSPLQYVVNWPVDVVDWVSTSVTTHSRLLEENTSLRAEQVLLNARMEKLLSLQHENHQLRALLDSTPQTKTARMLVAQVLAVDSATYLQQIVINRGSSNQVFVGQPVIDASGVVGQVVSVSNLTSRVMLLTDSQSSIPVQDTRNTLRGIVNGDGLYDGLRLVHVPMTTDVKVGDNLISSGLGLRYPMGYPVGTITRVSHDSSQTFLTITVQPASRLVNNRLVLLVWPSEQKTIKSARQQLAVLQQLSSQRKQMTGSLNA
jgi:rod shape-determining protein MreC